MPDILVGFEFKFLEQEVTNEPHQERLARDAMKSGSGSFMDVVKPKEVGMSLTRELHCGREVS